MCRAPEADESDQLKPDGDANDNAQTVQEDPEHEAQLEELFQLITLAIQQFTQAELDFLFRVIDDFRANAKPS